MTDRIDSRVVALEAQIVQPANQTALQITQKGITSASTSTGGAVNIDNTLNTGPAVVIYSNQAAPAGRLFVVRQDNASFSQAAARIQSAGSGAALDVNGSGTGVGLTVSQSAVAAGGASSHALSALQQATSGGFASAGNFVSSNPDASSVQVTGVESGRGSIKCAHVNDGVQDDTNASALSLDLRTTGVAGSTAAQGIFLDATTGGTDGKLLNLRNDGNLHLQLRSAKVADRTGATAHVTPIIEIGSTSIQVTCGSGSPEGIVTAPTGSLYLRQGGGANATLYVKESGVGNTGWVAK